MVRRMLPCAVVLAALSLACTIAPNLLVACPYCSPTQQTFGEELAGADVAVVAVEVRVAKKEPAKAAPAPDGSAGAFTPEPKTRFKIVQVLKGEKLLVDKQGKPVTEFEVLYFGHQPEGTKFYATAQDPKQLNWSTPIALSERSLAYILKLPSLPADGADRLAYFQDFLESPEEMLARDSYDEFAKSPYEAVQALKPRMKHDQLVTWIKDTKIPASRRRLYLTMLGVCGVPGDLPLLEQMITSADQETKFVLDALLGCYLVLRGPEGMPLVENEFLKNPKAKYTDIWSTIQSLRILGQVSKAIPRERLVAAFRLMLERPQLADLVIPDLARWEDWDSMDKLVHLFKTSDDNGSFVRVPVMRYLMACPKPEAKKHLDELAKLDPDALKRATTFLPAPRVEKKDEAGDKKEGDKKDDAKAEGKTAEGKAAEGKAADTKAPPSGAKAGS